MRNLVMVIDRDYEIALVNSLIYISRAAEERWGSWRIPHAITERLQVKRRRPRRLQLQALDVRVGILYAPGLEVILRCNPCD